MVCSQSYKEADLGVKLGFLLEFCSSRCLGLSYIDSLWTRGNKVFVSIKSKCACELAPSYLTLYDPMGCSLPGSPVHGILQAGILEWVAISFSRGSSWPRDRTCVSCIGRQILYRWAPWKAPETGPNAEAASKPWGRGSLLPSSCGQDKLTETRILNIQRGCCYPEIFITKIFCKPKSLSCNYIQNGACFLPHSLKINSRNHDPSVLLFGPFPFPGVRYTRYGNLQAARLSLNYMTSLASFLTPLPKFKIKWHQENILLKFYVCACVCSHTCALSG